MLRVVGSSSAGGVFARSGRALFSTSAASSQQGKFDVMSFINRIDKLYEPSDKKESKPSTRKVVSKDLMKKPAERPAHAAGQNRSHNQRSRPKQASGSASGSAPGSDSSAWSSRVRQFTNSNNNRSSGESRGPPRDSPRAPREARHTPGQSSEKLELHVAPATTKQYQNAFSTARRAGGFRAKQSPRTSGPRAGRASGGPGNRRRPQNRDRRTGSASAANAPRPVAAKSGITASDGIALLRNFMDQSVPISSATSFVPVKNPTAPENIISNLVPTAISYDTRVWSAINTLRLNSHQRRLIRSNRELIADIVSQTVNGSTSKYVVSAGSQFATLNANSTLPPSAKLLISQIASGKIPISQLKSA